MVRDQASVGGNRITGFLVEISAFSLYERNGFFYELKMQKWFSSIKIQIIISVQQRQKKQWLFEGSNIS